MENPIVNLLAIVGTIVTAAGLIPVLFLLWPGGQVEEPADE